MVEFLRVLQYLDNNPLWNVFFGYYFLLVCGLHYTSVTVFYRAEFFIVMKPSISIISFMDCVFGIVSKKASVFLRSFRFYSMLFSRSFIVLCFTFRSMINFELIFLKNVSFVSWFIFFCKWMSSYSSTICWRDYLCSVTFVSLSKISWLSLCGSISGSLFCPLIYLFFFQY